MFRGVYNRIKPTPWNYAQYEKDILDCAFYLVREIGKVCTQTSYRYYYHPEEVHYWLRPRLRISWKIDLELFLSVDIPRSLQYSRVNGLGDVLILCFLVRVVVAII